MQLLPCCGSFLPGFVSLPKSLSWLEGRGLGTFTSPRLCAYQSPTPSSSQAQASNTSGPPKTPRPPDSNKSGRVHGAMGHCLALLEKPCKPGKNLDFSFRRGLWGGQAKAGGELPSRASLAWPSMLRPRCKSEGTGPNNHAMCVHSSAGSPKDVMPGC